MTHPKQQRKAIRELDAQIGRRQRGQRIAAGLTQQQIGDTLGVSFLQVQKYKRGQSRVSSATCIAWLMAVGQAPDCILRELEVPAQTTAAT